MLYYYQGLPSWDWYYPFHYAPFASDLVGCSSLTIKFRHGRPFRPYDQLMAVLPPRSAEPAGLPPALKALMLDTTSSIADFYPKDFALDLNGKRFLWQAVVLLPFIAEDRLLGAIANAIESSELTDDEISRNARRSARVYFQSDDFLAKQLVSSSNNVDDDSCYFTLSDLAFTDPRGHGQKLFGKVKAIVSSGSSVDYHDCSGLPSMRQEVLSVSSSTVVGGDYIDDPRLIDMATSAEDLRRLDPHTMYDDDKFANLVVDHKESTSPTITKERSEGSASSYHRNVHSCQMLPGRVRPKQVVSATDLEDVGTLRGFGGELAKQMIVRCLDNLGFKCQASYNRMPSWSTSGPPPPQQPGNYYQQQHQQRRY
jgi:5'-3' exonuclease